MKKIKSNNNSLIPAKKAARKGRACRYLFSPTRSHGSLAIKSLQIQLCWSTDGVRDSVKWPRARCLSAVLPADTLGGGKVACPKDVVTAVPRLSPVAGEVTCCCGQELCLGTCSNPGEDQVGMARGHCLEQSRRTMPWDGCQEPRSSTPAWVPPWQRAAAQPQSAQPSTSLSRFSAVGPAPRVRVHTDTHPALCSPDPWALGSCAKHHTRDHGVAASIDAVCPSVRPRAVDHF